MDLRTDSVNDILEHYGVKRRSGRYPFGSGDRPYQHGSPSRGKDGGQYKIKYSVEKAKGNLQSLDRQDVLKRMPKGKLIASTVASTAITAPILGPYAALVPGVVLKQYMGKYMESLTAAQFADVTDYMKFEGNRESLKDMDRITPPPPKDNISPNRVNPDKNFFGTQNNCQYCVLAADMRERGYDVRARKRSEGGPMDDLTKWYKDVKIVNYAEPKESMGKPADERRKEAYNKIMNELEQQGEGARGYFGVNFIGWAGGHAMMYKVENGKAVIYDPQSKADVNNVIALAEPSGFRYARLDNCEPTNKIGDCVISSSKKNDKINVKLLGDNDDTYRDEWGFVRGKRK